MPLSDTAAARLPFLTFFITPQVMRDNFQAHELRTLAVIAFPLGSWVGGLFTYNCLRYLTNKGYKVGGCGG